MSEPPKQAPPPRTVRPRPTQTPRRLGVVAVTPPPETQLAVAALTAELEQLREAQAVLLAELSVRDSETGAAREALTKTDGWLAETRRGWQQATETVSDMRRALADADLATQEARRDGVRQAEALQLELRVREQSIEDLTADIAAARAQIGVREGELDTLRAEIETQRASLTAMAGAEAAHAQALNDLRSQLAQQEVQAATEIRDLRERLTARSDELSALSLQTASRMAELVSAGIAQGETIARLNNDLSAARAELSSRIGELVSAGMAQGETIARLTNDLGAARIELMREATAHAEARRVIETGEAALLRVRGELDQARRLAEGQAAAVEQLREQIWSLESDLSASRQRGAQQDDRIVALQDELARAELARAAAADDAATLAARVESDAAELAALRESLSGAKDAMRQLATMPASIQSVPAPVAKANPDSRQATLVRAGTDREFAALRAELAARDEARLARERALDEARRDALAAEAMAAQAKLEIAERDAMITRLSADVVGRDNDNTALETRVRSLVRQNDQSAAEQGKLNRRLTAISGSVSYRLGLAGAAISRTWQRVVRRVRHIRSGRANPLFDFGWYLDQNPDVRWSGVDPYGHYLRHGRAEGRTPNRIFQPGWYLAANPDVAAAGVEPLDHFWRHGAAEGRNPAPEFDLRAYLERHPEAKARGRNPLLHYLKTAPAGEALPSGGRRILVVAWHCPTRAHAGGLRMLDLYDYLRRIAPDTRLDLFTVKKPAVDWAYDDLGAIFDNVYFTEHNDLSVAALNTLRADRVMYDVIDFQFLEAGHDLESYRSVGRKLIFTPMELLTRAFHLERQAQGRIATPQRMAEQMDISRRELALCRAVDEVVCVSRPDADYLRGVTDLGTVTALETGVSTLEFGALEPASDASRASKTVVFVAYFGSPTNLEALDWYVREVHPRIKAAVPDYRFDVVGRGDLSAYLGIDDPSLNIVGEVPSVGPYIARAALGISPALSGAGFRGKINQYALLGLPTVASPIAAEGFAYRHGVDILVAPDAGSFAESCIRLLTDPDMNKRLAEAAGRTCQAQYSWAVREGAIRSIYGIRKERQKGAPVVTAIVPSYSHGRYIEQRIRTILDQSYPNIDLIVIDDKSPDDSDEVIRRLRDRYGFTYIRRDKNSGTPFSAWAYAAEKATGDFIWICESDDAATLDFAATGVDRLCQDRSAVLFYSNSYVIDADGKMIGSTASYFRDIWQDPRWETGFTADGLKELADYQVRGMIVPNMSSALIRADAFRSAFKPDVLKFGLTGDWLFIGRVLTRGRAIFDVQPLNYFRQHAVTSRERVKSARSQAEFIMTKYRLHKLARKRARDLAVTLKTDATRFIYEPASGRSIVRAMMRISVLDTVRICAMLSWSMLFHRHYWSKFRARVKDRRAEAGG